MSEVPNTHSNLNDETLFSLKKNNKIEEYCTTEIKEREAMNKRLVKYIATFDYIGKTLIVLSATKGVISIISFSSIIVTPVGIPSASFSLAFSLTTRIIKKLLKQQEIKRRNIRGLIY